MKRIKLGLMIVSLLLLCSCKNNYIDNINDINKKIIEAHQNAYVNILDLNEEEKQVLQAFFASQKLENKIINISENIMFSDQSYSEEEKTSGIYEKNGELFIKYSDLNWIQVDGDYKAIINYDHKSSALFKSLVPVLYTDTHDKLKYNYAYMDRIVNDSESKYYYKSVYDGSGLIIKSKLDKGKIVEISTIYQDIFYMPSNSKNGNAINGLVISIIAVIIVSLVLFIWKNYKKYHNTSF